MNGEGSAMVVGRWRPAHDGIPAKRLRRVRWVLSALIVACVGCANAGASSPGPAGSSPLKSAKMICAREAQKDIREALGVATTGPILPTWTDHRYACTYPYADGRIGLSVKELPDDEATTAYFASARAGLGGPVSAVPGLGQGAFQGPDGSLVVRKDFKVLAVDVGSEPAQLGTPPIDRSEAAVRVAIVVLGCWTGD